MAEDHPMTHNELHRHVQKSIEENMQEDKFVSLSAEEPNKHWPAAQLDGIKGTTTQRLTIKPDCYGQQWGRFSL